MVPLESIVSNPKAFFASEGSDSRWKDLALQTVERAHRPDLRFGSDNLVRLLVDSFGLSFGGVYINNQLNISVELDRQSGHTVYDRTAEFDSDMAVAKNAALQQGAGVSKLVLPLSYRGKNFGVTLFEKESFSDEEIASIAYCVKLFSTHINTARRIYALEKDVFTDFLTGAGNRRRYDSDSSQMLKHSKKTGQPLSFIALDIDYFKRLNDTYLHQYGDFVLSSVAKILMDNVREGRVYRYGGEEFVILLPNTTLVDADKVARRLNDAIRAHYFDGGLKGRRAAKTYVGRRTSHYVRVSMGVASTENLKGRGRADNLLKAADKNLYRAKTFRDSVMAGWKNDPFTGLPEVTTFYDYLKSALQDCNRSRGSLLVCMFDVVRFSSMINSAGAESAWRNYREAVTSINGNSPFDLVARVCDSDRVLAGIFRREGVDRFMMGSEQACLDTLAALRKYMDFACGAAVYSPDMVKPAQAKDLAADPARMLSLVQNLAYEAGDRDDRFSIGFYAP
ncbi:GGDEF domain-containing protein [Candidatus Woesearchaeota archaeon]|nr:GGDEF domain-containing protein [Candidatus Woesearchaeota archaeon]